MTSQHDRIDAEAKAAAVAAYAKFHTDGPLNTTQNLETARRVIGIINCTSEPEFARLENNVTVRRLGIFRELIPEGYFNRVGPVDWRRFKIRQFFLLNAQLEDYLANPYVDENQAFWRECADMVRVQRAIW